jgi:16S rRNA (cytosine967-C5)-methyltransferase
MTPVTARELAIDALVRVEDGAYANVLLPSMLRRQELDARDRAFATDLVYGTLRRCGSIDYLLAQAMDRPGAKLDAPVRAALRLGVYQLVEGVPAHAAVSETVNAAGRRSHRARGFVNAVLRRVAGLGPQWRWPAGDDVDAIATRSSHPPWIVARLLDDLGPSDTHALLDADNEPAAVAVRVNRRVTTSVAVAEELRGVGAQVAPGRLAPGSLEVRGAGDPASLRAVREGRATPQDQASQAVVDIVAPRPGERVVDLAAAPGGKAGAIAERTEGGLVVAVDVNPDRLRLVGDAAMRLGLRGLVSIQADGRRPPLRAGTFDRVLVDAPCSGLGVLRRRPDARWRVRPESVARLAQLQRELLGAAAALVRPGGIVVYAVCTVTWAETREVDAWVAAELAQLVALPPPGPPWRPWGRGALLLPFVAGTDGMFVLALQHGPDRIRR